MKQKLKLFAGILALLVCVMLPLGAAARDWWTMEAAYLLQDRPPVTETGSYSRIFLPRVTAQTVDGIAMDMTYQVSRGGDVLAEGAYTEGTYFDLSGAGTYLFTLQGVEASNAYIFEVRAEDALASFVAEMPVPTQLKLSEAFSTPAAKILWQGSEQEAEISLNMADGAVYRYEEKAVPQAGRMTVCYRASFAGQTQEFSFEISVLDDTLGFYDEGGGFYPAGTTPFEDDELRGVVLNGTSAKTYTFSKILNLSAVTKDDPLIVLNNAATEAERVVPKVRIIPKITLKFRDDGLPIMRTWSTRLPRRQARALSAISAARASITVRLSVRKRISRLRCWSVRSIPLFSLTMPGKRLSTQAGTAKCA